MQRLNLTNSSFLYIIIIAALFFGSVIGLFLGFKGEYKLVLAGLLGIIFLILSLSKPWVAVSLFFFLIPLENLFVFEGGLSSTLTKMLGAYLFFLVIVNGSLSHIKEVFSNKKSLALILFGIVTITSSVLSGNVSLSVTFIISLGLSILLCFILVLLIRDTKTLNLATWALIAGSVISILSPVIFGIGRVGGDILQRFGGLWGDQNEFAALLLIPLSLSILNIVVSKRFVYKIMSIAFAVILLVGLILTYSRGGLLALFLMTILAMFKFITGKNRIKVLAITVPCMIVAFVIFNQFFAEEILSRMETLKFVGSKESVTKDASLRLRYYYYFDLAPSLFADNPLLGLGMRQIIYKNPHGQVMHNTYLEVLIGAGIIGLFIFMTIIYLSWKDLKKVQKYANHNSYLKLYADAFELGFIGYLAAGVFVSLDMNKMFWLSVAITSVLVNINRIQMGSGTRRNNFNPAYYTETKGL